MSSKTIQMSDDLHAYLLRVSLREPEVLRRLREETRPMEAAGMQISPEHGQFMRLLLKLIGAKRTLEVGTFTGYSALATALALPEDGCVIACDVSEEWTSIGRRYWEEAGVAHKIDLRIGPAAETLAALLDDGQAGSFDFAFIDADKNNYDTYYEHALQLVKQGGLIAIDNVLWGGRVIDDERNDDDTRPSARSTKSYTTTNASTSASSPSATG